MKNFKTNLILVLATAVFGVIQFLICVTIAVVNYDAPFSMAKNFLSELGQTTNDLSFVFNLSLAFLGLSQAPLFAILSLLNPNDSLSIRAASVMGVISCLGLVGLGFTPLDQLFILHHVALAIWLFPMLICWVLFFVGASNSPYVGVGFLSVSLIVVVTMIVVMFRANWSGYELLQKVVVVCGMVWLTFVLGFICQAGYSVLKNLDPEGEDPHDKELAYLRKLSQKSKRR